MKYRVNWEQLNSKDLTVTEIERQTFFTSHGAIIDNMGSWDDVPGKFDYLDYTLHHYFEAKDNKAAARYLETYLDRVEHWDGPAAYNCYQLDDEVWVMAFDEDTEL